MGRHLSLKKSIMVPIAKIWMQFICTYLCPALDTNNVNVFREDQVYSILQYKRVYVDRWISQNLKCCIVGDKVVIYILHFVTDLYRKAGMEIASIEQTHHPFRSIISGSLLHQF